MRVLLTLIAIMFCLQSFGQDRNAQKKYEDSLMRVTYKKMADNKKGEARYYKELYDKTKNKVYLDSTKAIINTHKKRIDENVKARKQKYHQ